MICQAQKMRRKRAKFARKRDSCRRRTTKIRTKKTTRRKIGLLCVKQGSFGGNRGIESKRGDKNNVRRGNVKSLDLLHAGRVRDMQDALRLRANKTTALILRSANSSLAVRTMCRIIGNLRQCLCIAFVLTRGVITALHSIGALP